MTRRWIFTILLMLGAGTPACRPSPAHPIESPSAALTATTSPSPTPGLAFSASSPTPTAHPGPTSPPTFTPTPDPYLDARQRMVEKQMRERDITDERVLAVMEKVPRHEFVLPDVLDQAYADHPLPIGYGQTISQPYIVALMTQMLDLKPGDKVLEIGTGSGYQAAVLAELTDQVYTIEIIPELAQRARATLDRLGYGYVESKQADGYWGWEEHAPFNAIVVTAAPDHVPQPLLNQLADGGRMVIPVGPPGGYQSLWLITREGDEFHNFNWGGVLFVPLTRGE
jgi:protein-L-isoaspartate(D-aspartate) O-methyltransferase